MDFSNLDQDVKNISSIINNQCIRHEKLIRSKLQQYEDQSMYELMTENKILAKQVVNLVQQLQLKDDLIDEIQRESLRRTDEKQKRILELENRLDKAERKILEQSGCIGRAEKAEQELNEFKTDKLSKVVLALQISYDTVDELKQELQKSEIKNNELSQQLTQKDQQISELQNELVEKSEIIAQLEDDSPSMSQTMSFIESALGLSHRSLSPGRNKGSLGRSLPVSSNAHLRYEHRDEMRKLQNHRYLESRIMKNRIKDLEVRSKLLEMIQQ